MASARSRRSCSTGSATRPSPTRSAASSMKARRAHGLPVHLHLRRLARPRARRRRLAPRQGGRRGRAHGLVYAPVGWATHYHADYVLPTWASSMAKNAIVGAHLFYRWGGGWGQAAAFTAAIQDASPMPPRSAPPRLPCRTSRRSMASRAARQGDRRDPGRARRSSSSRRCAATSASRSASTSSRARRRRTSRRGLYEEVRSLGQSQICTLAGHGRRRTSSRSASLRRACRSGGGSSRR